MKTVLYGLIIKFFASFLIWFLFLGLGILWIIDGKIKKEQVIHAVYSGVFAWITALIIKHFFPTVRPYIMQGLDAGVIIPPLNASFPSEHAVIAFAVSVTIFLHDKKVGWVFLVAALLIGMARVTANVHYPIDILGGAFVGTIAAVIIDRTHFFNAAKRFSKPHKSGRRKR